MQEVLNHFDDLEQDPHCPVCPDVFLDLSEVESLPETPQLSMVVRALRRIRPKVSFGACAILARRDALVGMMRIFEVLAEEVFRSTATFRDAREAEIWLVSHRKFGEGKSQGGR
jgi:hypothetical protein